MINAGDAAACVNDGVRDGDHEVILVLDLGSTWLKGGLARADGSLLYIDRVASPLRGATALDAETVWQAVLSMLLRLHGKAGQGKALAIAITGATRTHVFLDGQGQPCGPVMLWNDPAGAQHGDCVAQAYGISGSSAGYGAFHPLSRVLQFAQDHDGVLPHAMAEIKDWLNSRLTGRLVTDDVAYGRIVSGHGGDTCLFDVLGRLGLRTSVVPSPASPVSVLGMATCSGLQGVPVVVGSFDTWASCLGMGAMLDGGVYDISGTTQVLGTFSVRPRPVKGMVSMPWTDTLWQTGGPCQTGMGSLAWFARAFLDSDDPADTLAAAQASSANDVPLCLPYLSGERMPLWNDTLSASFHGVKSHHVRADMAQALVEGLVLAHRLALDVMQVRGPDAVLHMSGGGAQLPQWVQARADGFDMAIELCLAEETALAGAALAAGVATGRYDSIAAAQSVVAAGHSRILPRRERAAYFESKAAAFSSMLSRDVSLS